MDKKEHTATMQAMSLDRVGLKLLGIIRTDDKSYYIRISIIVCFAVPVIFLWPVIWYFVDHITDVAEATNAFYMVCTVGMSTSIYTEFWFKRQSILSILQQIQMLVDNASKEYRPLYEQTESLAHTVVYYFRLFIFITVFGVISVPISILIAISVIGGDVTNWRILPAAMK